VIYPGSIRILTDILAEDIRTGDMILLSNGEWFGPVCCIEYNWQNGYVSAHNLKGKTLHYLTNEVVQRVDREKV
jgi:hypothetical protein